MIKVVANNYIKAECVDAYLAIAKELVEKTHANDAGCIKYELCRDVGDPLHFAMIEEWESKEALDAHMKSPHFTGLIPKTEGLIAKPPAITLFEKEF